MTIHVNIGEAQTRLSELVAAAVRGEEVVLDMAGAPQVRLVPVATMDEASATTETSSASVRLVPVATMDEAERQRIRAKRESAFGMYAHLVGGRSIDVRSLKMTDAEWEERNWKKFGPPD